LLPGVGDDGRRVADEASTVKAVAGQPTAILGDRVLSHLARRPRRIVPSHGAARQDRDGFRVETLRRSVLYQHLYIAGDRSARNYNRTLHLRVEATMIVVGGFASELYREGIAVVERSGRREGGYTARAHHEVQKDWHVERFVGWPRQRRAILRK